MKKFILTALFSITSLAFAGSTNRSLTFTALTGDQDQNVRSGLFYRDCDVTPCVDRLVGTAARLPVKTELDASALTVTGLSLDTSTNTIGTIAIQAGQTLGLDGGTNTIGVVAIKAAQTIGLNAGTNFIGSVSVTASVDNVDTFRRLTGVTSIGPFTVWTPGTGKKFRIRGLCGRCTANSATSGGAVVSVAFFDGATTITTGSLYLPNSAATSSAGNTEFIDRYKNYWGDGYISSAANTPLTMTISAALTSGQLDFFFAGKEE